jgi:lipopolysaccharide/colanic/teichoic acid biosynthesis glycosyltransferase
MPGLARVYPMLKQTFDFGCALALLVLTLPITAIAMVVVVLTSPGPPIYAQKRIGRGGRTFTIYKIRSMVVDSEKGTGPRWCVPGDPRITRVGQLLRATHIDELPQLWNVLRGEMSLIGPRPERPEIASHLERAIPYYGLRTLVRPGLTGLAQVQLPPDTDLDSVRRKLACDIYYIQQINPWLDLRILLSTVFHVLGVPFTVPRAVLRVPSGEVVEMAYRLLLERGATQGQPA